MAADIASQCCQSPIALLSSLPRRLTEFTLIISVNQPRSYDEALSQVLWGLEPPSPQVPLLRAQSAGMIGELSISVKELGIIETHPDSIIDLRLTRPFPQLLELANTFDLGTTDTMEHSHIPFPFILLKKLSEWQQKVCPRLMLSPQYFTDTRIIYPSMVDSCPPLEIENNSFSLSMQLA